VSTFQILVSGTAMDILSTFDMLVSGTDVDTGNEIGVNVP